MNGVEEGVVGSIRHRRQRVPRRGRRVAGVLTVVALLVGALAPVSAAAAPSVTQIGVAGWGSNSFGRLDAPAGLTDITAVAAGFLHSLALRSDGTVTAWGSNSYGQSHVPDGLTDVTAIAAGEMHSLALQSDGTVSGWGRNDYEQTRVPDGLTDVTAIAAASSTQSRAAK